MMISDACFLQNVSHLYSLFLLFMIIFARLLYYSQIENNLDLLKYQFF